MLAYRGRQVIVKNKGHGIECDMWSVGVMTYALVGGRLPFDTDDEGYAILLVDGTVPAELEEKAQLAADNCPEFAIEIVDD